jgi:predicted outer membrane protein
VFGPSRRWAAILVTVASLTAASLSACGGDDGQESTTASAATETTIEQSVTETRERLDDLVRELLTKRGLDPAVIDCALQRLSETISDEEIEAAAAAIKRTGSPTAAVIDAATQAGQSCSGD